MVGTMNNALPAIKFQRITSGPFEGYVSADGRIEITDNGPGMAGSAGSGRWALTIEGRWMANIDTLREAKARAAKIVLIAESPLDAICRRAREREEYIVAHPDEFDRETVALAKNGIYQHERLSVASILRYD